jgi:hypothetical protein
MKKIILSIFFLLAVVLQTQATGTGAAYSNNNIQKNENNALLSQQNNAMQLATLRIAVEKQLENTSKIAFSKRLALKSVLNKIRKAEKTNADLNQTLMTIGLILMIVGLVLLVLGIALSGGHYYGGGGGLIVLGLILWLVGKFVDL